MQTNKKTLKVLMSGGGTGGHIYPAVAIAQEIQRREPTTEFLFVGAADKMEMQKVPEAGFPIEGLWISGINRSKPLSNFKFPFQVFSSLRTSGKIVRTFQPDIAIGTGGFASGPALWAAAQRKVPILLQEQNAFPGITNRFLAKKASAICTAYPEIPKFPKDKIHVTGNPVRTSLFEGIPSQIEAKKHFGMDANKTTILSVGGSLGSRTLNKAWENGHQQLEQNNLQLLWQTGKLDYQKLSTHSDLSVPYLHLKEFIRDMKWAYAAADIIVSRAGAMAISELSIVGKPCILLPFPYAAEDHQTKNAQALVQQDAARMLTDQEADGNLVKEVIALSANASLREQLGYNLKKLGKPNATAEIVDIVQNLLHA